MHLLIPFAFCDTEDCRAALQPLAWRNLGHLLRRLTLTQTEAGDAFSLSPPHERVMARARGLPLQDGLLAQAALEAAGLPGADPAPGSAWGFVTLCHWQVGSHQIMMQGQPLSGLDEAQSRTLLADMARYFNEDGLRLHYQTPNRWLAEGPVLAQLPTASIDRVAGRDVASWLPEGAGAAGIRRLQTEMQMLLYNHPLNEARERQGLPVVNAFWLSGTGALPGTHSAGTPPRVIDSLREAALQNDWLAWAQAWQALDAQEFAPLLANLESVARPGAAFTLTLCGERQARSWEARPQPILRRFMNQFGTRSLLPLIEML